MTSPQGAAADGPAGESNSTHIAVICNQQGLLSELSSVCGPFRIGPPRYPGGKNAPIELGCSTIVGAGRVRIAKLCARDRDGDPSGSLQNHDRGANGTCGAPHRSGRCSTSAPENLQLSRRTQNGHLVVRIILQDSQGKATRSTSRLPDCSGSSDRSVRS